MVHARNTEKRFLQEILIRMELNILSFVITGYNVPNSLLHCVTGPHCETCASGHFGDAKNGGTCKGTVTAPVLCSLWKMLNLAASSATCRSLPCV